MSEKKQRLLNRIPAIRVFPVLENGTFAAKATEGEALPIRATVFREGHDTYCAEAVLITPDGREHSRAKMYDIAPGLDRYEAWVQPDRPGLWSFRIDTWSDPWGTWKHAAEVKIAAEIDQELMCEEGALLLERAATGSNYAGRRPPSRPAYRRTKPGKAALAEIERAIAILRDRNRSPEERFAAALATRINRVFELSPLRDYIEATVPYPLQVDRKTALYGSWYEIFPRSYGAHVDADGNWISGTLTKAAEDLPRIADHGFTVVYLTPIHPIGTQFRKGRNNALEARPGDPGSPYGIGSEDGGHDAIHPELGDFDDFDAFVDRAEQLGLEVALDLALQCSPDHPWVKDHPDWFTTRADGSIAYAENPPKKYQDIYPLNFDNDPQGIYDAIVDVVELWISHGVKIFRVDNPHTKPIAFWQRFLAQMRADHPDVLFLAEAFTRPPMMQSLGMVGFHQSYTYFAWRTTKQELEEYLVEVAEHSAHTMRPAFWPTTHDILTPQMTTGGIAIFAIRALLAAAGAPTWGIYSGYELVENVQRPGFEEQIDNEKYEFRPRVWSRGNELGIASLLQRLNAAREAHPALQQLHQVTIHPTSSDDMLCFSKHVPARFSPTGKDDTVIAVISLNPYRVVEGTVYLDPARLFPSLSAGGARAEIGPYGIELVDELDGNQYRWYQENFVRLSPWDRTGHLFAVRHTEDGVQ